MLQSIARSFVFVVLLVVYAPTSGAADDNLKIPDFYSEPGANKGRAYENGLANESIDPFSGGLSLQYQDLVLPGNGGMDIVVNRTYRSLQGVEPILEQRQERNVVGIGWDIHFGRVWTAPNTVLCDTTGTVTTGPNLPASNRNPVFEGPDGTRRVLVTEYSSSTSYHMISKDRWIATCIPASSNPYANIQGLEVKSPDGMTYTFGIRGRVEIGNQASNLPLLVNRIEDRNGNAIIVEYDLTSSSYALIDRVRALDGRVVSFSYTQGQLPEDVHLSSITAFPGTPYARTWRYTYSQAQFTSNGFTSPWYLLKTVQSPEDEIKWIYSYYPDDPDGPNADGVYSANRFSLKSVTLPESATIQYQYGAESFDSRPGPYGEDIHTTVVTSKSQSGADIANGTWSYSYSPGTEDVTTVSGPQYCTTYRHVGVKSVSFGGGVADNGVWKIGLLLKRTVFENNCGGTALESESIQWGRQLLSAQNEFRPSRSAIDENTYAPYMVKRTIQRDGTDYVTTYLNHDQYGNPGTVVEEGQDTRTTQFTYAPNTSKWLLKLVEQETIEGVGDIARTFDSNGNVESETKYGVTTLFGYYSTGDVAIIRDARGFDKRYNNYFRGVPQNEQHPENVVINRIANETGTVQSETNGRGRTTQYTYDSLNRITSIARPRGAVITVSRPDANETVLTRGGFRKRELRDGVGRVTASISEDLVAGESIQQTFVYDNIGNKIFESYPNSAQGVSTTFDSLGRVLTRSEPDGVTTRFSYLPANQADVTDPRSNVTRFFYRAYGSPDQRALMRIESPEAVVTTMTRNKLDLITSVAQGGLQRTFVYDTRYYLISESHPEVGVIEYTRDALGNKQSERYGAGANVKVRTFAYDQLNRLTTVNYPGFAPNIFYQYDANNNLTSLTRGGVDWSYGYDDNDNLTAENLVVDSQQFSLSYQYDDLDALTNVTYPRGLTVNFSPNRYGWPTQASGFVSAVEYHPSGHIRTIQYANGIQQSIQLNNRLLPSNIAAPDVIDLAYQYDLAGNVSYILDALQPANDVQLGYDAINRLTTANGPWGVGTFNYDAMGNLVQKDMDGESQSYTYNVTSNLLESVSGIVGSLFSYDVFGNVTADGEHTYVYDESSDLTAVTGGPLFYYDGNKRRTVEEKSDTTIYTVYNQAGQLMFESDESNLITKEYIRLGSTLVAIREDACNETSEDTDGDGIPNCFEEKIGLNPADASDGAADADDDGLSNFEEFQNGTDAFRSDSDNDGLPDGFEVQYGLNALVDDAGQDLDGDGFSNYQEFEGRSDPGDSESRPNGSIKWSVAVDGVASFPAVGSDGTIYLVASNGGVATLYAFSEAGALTWSQVLPGPGSCQVFANSGEEGEEPPEEELPFGETFGIIAGQVAVSGAGVIYASCDGEGTFAYDAAGTLLWSHSTGGFFAVTNNRVYVSTAMTPTAEIHALDSGQGTPLWTYTTTAEPFGDSVVAGIDNVVYAVTGCNAPTDRLPAVRELVCESTAGRSIELHAINADGNVSWTYTDAGDVYGKPVIGIDGSVYLGVDAGGRQGSILAINPDGSLQRRTKGNLGLTDPEVNPPTSPVIDVRGNLHTVPMRVRQLRPDLTEDPQWESYLEPLALNFGLHSPVLAGSGRVYLATSESWNWVHGLAADGAQEWATSYIFDVNPTISDVTMTPGGSLLAVTIGATSTLYALVDNDNPEISQSIWPIRGANTRQTRSVEGCNNQDQDGDGLTDCYERWINSDPADPGDATLDFDGDGLTNLMESAMRTHPYNADTDGDTMPDAYEAAHGLDPRSNTSLEDSDGDGANDAIEYRVGTDPTDAASVPSAGTLVWEYTVDAPVESAPVHHRNRNPVFTGIGEVDYLGNLVWGSGGGIFDVMPMISSEDVLISSAPPGFFNVWLSFLNGNTYSRRTFGNEVGPGFANGTNGTVYFGSSPGNLHRIDGPGNNWSYVFDADVSTAPVVNTDGTVIVGTADGVVHALDDTGIELWSFAAQSVLGVPAIGQIAGSPAIDAGGVLYIPAMITPVSVCDPAAGDPPDCVPVPVGPTETRLFAIAPDGTLLWSLPLAVGADVSTAPVIAVDGTVVITCEDGFVYAVDPAGTLKWSYETAGPIRSNPVIGADNNIYFGSDDGFVYSLRADGTVSWRVSVGASIGSASPYIDDKGIMYIGTSVNQLLGIYTGVKGIAASAWPTIGHDVHRTGNVATQLNDIDQPPDLQVISPANGSMHAEGDLIVLEATATDLEDGDLANAISWESSLDGPLGTGGRLELTTLTVGHHIITAAVSDSGTNNAAQTVEIDVDAAQVVVTLSTDVESPQIAGALVTVSAAIDGGTSGYEYRFRVKGDATNDAWVVLNDYSAQSSTVWDTTAYPGKNRLQVTVRETGSTGDVIRSGKTFWVNGPDPADAVSLSSDLTSPQEVGQIVTLNGAASGGAGPYEYRFEVRSVTADGEWQVLQDYSAQASASWDTTGYLGKNRVRVFARKAGTLDQPVKQGQAYWVNGLNAATGADLTATPAGTQPSGTLINLEGTAQGGSGSYVYEFQLKGPTTGDAWVVLQDFSTLSSYDWDTSGILGEHRVRVRLKNAGTEDQPVKQGRRVILE